MFDLLSFNMQFPSVACVACLCFTLLVLSLILLLLIDTVLLKAVSLNGLLKKVLQATLIMRNQSRKPKRQLAVRARLIDSN